MVNLKDYMNIFRELNSLPDFSKAVVTIGSYDGVHNGHRSILQRVKRRAKEIGGQSILITFDPHPRQVIGKDTSLRLLNTLEEKAALCEEIGIDNMVVVPFTKEFADQSPEAYIEDFLVHYFKPAYIVIGYDHQFGKNRGGGIELLRSLSDTYGYAVDEIDPQEIDDLTISSTKTRKAIQLGDITQANSFLGYPYSLSGTVIHGKKLGRDIGYPTANIKINHKDKLIPGIGIYASKVIIDDIEYKGMSYIGFKPSIKEEDKKLVIEVNIFDFDASIYGKDITLEFHKKLREDKQHVSVESLKKQLVKDKEATLDYFSDSPKVCIAILNYNGQPYLEAYLPTMLYSSEDRYEVVVIDNASTDDSVSYVEEWHPEVRVIKLDVNHGFAEGYNQGLLQIDAPYVAIVNSDIEATDNWLDPLIEVLDNNPNVGAVQPKIKSLERRNQYEHAGASGGFIDSLGYPFCRGRIFDHIEEDRRQYDYPEYVAWASGAAMVVRTELFKALGGFDKAYFAHMEEIDFCYRLRACGYRIKAVPISTVYHLGGGTLAYVSPRKTFLNFRNSLYTIVKNNDGLRMWKKLGYRVLLDLVSIVFFIRKGEYANAVSVLKAHPALWRQWSYLKKQKRAFQSIKKNHAIGRPVYDGVYRNSIVYQHFVKGKNKFSDLDISHNIR